MVRALPGDGAPRITMLADVAPLLVVSKVVQDVGGVLTFVALLLVGLALVLAWLLARRLVLPLQTLALEARALRPGGRAAFSARGRPDEIGVLAERLETSFSELQAALRREHDFTRDVGHELRTPLTVMRNTLALAEARPLGRGDIEQLRAGLDEIGATIDVLFALARAEHVGRGVFDLRACIESCLLRLPGAGDWMEQRLRLALPERLPVNGNQHLAALLLNNCVGNALFHGGPQARLAIAWTDEKLAILNSVDAQQQGRVQGFAHGQDLLARIAGAMGWQIGFRHDAEGYRVEILPLPAA
jgi:signal transduction histidine kinase